MKLKSNLSGLTIVELSMTTAIVGLATAASCALLNMGTILGAKNTAVNTAHQQARTAMLQMVRDMHNAVSLPQLIDVNGIPIPMPSPGASPPSAAGIAFQLYSIGPLKVAADAEIGDTTLVIQGAGLKVPTISQRIIIPTHQIEADITNVQVQGSTWQLTLSQGLPVAVKGTQSPTNYNITCFITDRCSYIVSNGMLEWHGPTVRKAFAVLGAGMTNATPFSTPQTINGAYDYKFVAAIDLSTADTQYSNRGFKAANILLNGRVPMRARLTTYQ